MSILNRVIAHLYSLLGFFRLLENLIPQHVRDIFNRWQLSLEQYFNLNYNIISVPEHKGRFLWPSKIFGRANSYLTNLERKCHHPRALVAIRAPRKRTVILQPGSTEMIEDSFRGSKMWWTRSIEWKPMQKSDQLEEKRLFTLKVARPSKSLLYDYCAHLKKIADKIEEKNRDISLWINDHDEFSRILFNHPCTFDCLALDPSLKDRILTDLDNFREGKHFYGETGRAWKRGYLLSGPPGTGKSSLIAAIANYMKYDIYDFELSKVASNGKLRLLLSQTTRKSIILVEDIDCSLTESSPHPKSDDYSDVEDNDNVTLSGLLDLTDGLCSSLGDERIIIFTTTHPDDIDPALLRPGRMDMHIELSFCNFPAFKILARNYLQIEDHELYAAVKEKMAAGAKMVPVDIIEILLRNVDDPFRALNALLSALDAKLKETEYM
ncbi:hypothetical protein SUGI_0499900 [Cryptomeria japonica]|uniref:AAA-ATPase At4g25835-like n=1 Tax=Cryptomeria japonica TaxID=3369 RepID=UPI002408AE7C|nr:AAA-ATPase At4g25835-like [Cryptomeria japonica]GLJ26057.1 hypothetical protein SUGI_0499900 [Cryptomeria japonica]